MALAFITLVPDAITELTNLTGVVTDIDSGVDTPDGATVNWSGSGDIRLAVSFPTPPGDLRTGVGLQTARVRFQRTDLAPNNPTYSIGIQEDDGLGNKTVRASSTITTLPAGTAFNDITFNFDASILALQNGSELEVFLEQTGGSGGNPARRRGFNIDEVDVQLQYDTPPGFLSESNVVWV